MKKLVTILMIMLFGLSSSGATVQLHYCCGKLKTISFGHVKEDCGMQGKMGSKPCCETKSLSAKEQTKEHELYTVAFGTTAAIEPTVFYQHLPELILAPLQQVSPVVHEAPPLAKDISILNCVFRI